MDEPKLDPVLANFLRQAKKPKLINEENLVETAVELMGGKPRDYAIMNPRDLRDLIIKYKNENNKIHS